MASSCAAASERGNSSQSTGCQDFSPSDYDCLHRCLSDIALLDMASKARLLQSLSSYLSCVSATMSASTEDFSLSAWVGTLKVCLRNVEVIELHNLLVRELQNHTEFLTRPHSTNYMYTEVHRDENDEVLSRTLHLEVISVTLRCCIRILPLVDCFDTSVSLNGAALLDGLMQQLCSPIILFDILRRLLHSSGCSDELKCSTNARWRAAQGCGVRSELLATDASSQFERETQQRIEGFLAILEVYMDELLLCPDLGARFLSFQDEACLFFRQENLMSSFARHTEASLEAAFVHALLSCFTKMPVHASGTNVLSDESLVCNLSLPAGLLLLETLAAENVPTIYMTQVVQLVARVLHSSTSGDLDDEVAGMTSSVTPEDCSWWSGGVDWSYCLKRVSTKRDPVDWVLKPKCLPSITTIHFASSIFEQAMVLYRRFSASNHGNTGREECGQSTYQAADNLFVRFCVSKYRPLLDMFCSTSEVDSGAVFARKEGFACQMLERDKSLLQNGSPDVIDSRSDRYHNASRSEVKNEVLKTCVCHKNQEDQVGKFERTHNFDAMKETGGRIGASSLVSAVLHLGISSLECITREIGKLLRLSSDVILQFPRGGHVSSTTTFEDDTDRIFAFVSLYLSSFLPSDSQVLSKHDDAYSEQKTDSHLVAEKVPCGQRSLIRSVGKAILFFTNVFCGKVQNGAPGELLEDYFHLLESLVALLLVVDGRKSLIASSEKGSSTNPQLSVSHNESNVPVGNSSSEKIQQESGSFSWLGAMVLVLQNMLRELSSQQRPLPAFFLDFVLEQISRGDGLNVVAMAFSGPFGRCLDARDSHHGVMLNIGSFQSKGLVNQILRLALQKPNRSSSFSTLIGYTSSILEDLLPITVTLSLDEVAESLSCYEHVASTFTLACQFAVSEQLMVLRNGHECRSWLLSKMCEGIERLFTEGTAVAQLISNWTSAKTIPWAHYSKTKTFQSTCSLEVKNMSVGSNGEEGQLQFCSSFLVQVDLLRRAVGAMRNAADWFLIPELEFSSLFLKARTFLEAFSRLRRMVDRPVRHWRFHMFLQEQLSRHTYDETNSAKEDQLLDKQPVFSKTDVAMCNTSSHIKVTPVRKLFVPEKYEPNGDCGQVQGENGRSVVRVPILSGRAASEQTRDCAVELDDGRMSDDVELPSVKMSWSAKENNLHCRRIVSDVQQKDRQFGETLTWTRHTANDETSKVPLVNKRITRSAAMSMVETSGGGADMPAAEVVLHAVEPLESKKRLSYSSTTLAIAKRLTQMRQPPRKKIKGDTRGSAERYAKELDSVPLAWRVPENTCLEIMQKKHTDSFAHQGAVSTSVVSNPYVETLSEKSSCQERFDDLNDFIVCKKGRNYSEWLKKRQKVRRRIHTRNLFKRLQEKRDLLLLLDICE